MPYADHYQVPVGLPAHLCSGREGFDALCSLLTIASTKQKQAISNASFVKRFLRSNGPPVPRQTKNRRASAPQPDVILQRPGVAPRALAKPLP